MGTYRTALKKFMDSFNLSFDFLPEKKIERDYGTVFCNVLNVYKGKSFMKEFRVCNVRDKDGKYKPVEGNIEVITDNLRKTIFAYLGAEDVAKELMGLSTEYTEKLYGEGNFD